MTSFLRVRAVWVMQNERRFFIWKIISECKYSLLIGHKSYNMLSILNILPLQKELQNNNNDK